MNTDELDFELPPELIAQFPAAERVGSRLLHYRRAERSIAHRQFADLPSILREGDLLVMNDTRVIPARFAMRKESGGLIEGLFLEELARGRWKVLLKNAGNIRAEVKLSLAEFEAHVMENLGGGEYVMEVKSDLESSEILRQIGRMPLPPYIKRLKEKDDRDAMDRERYQTVFAKGKEGSVAAPTAGLHFNDAIFSELEKKGISRAFVTLEVGMGTFKPVQSDTLAGHEMHEERYAISNECAAAINLAKKEGRRVVAVGTTTTRVLESQPRGEMKACEGSTRIFIYPPYDWKWVDALITNFHLPRSTLIALVAALVGLDEQRRIYAEAIRERYRFFSYGDAMIIE